MSIITRFAPSPTGYLHIGGARTALFNYLFAKANNGKFLLRIEDTDRERSTQAACDAIFSGLKWLGLNWDGEVIFQSQRNQLYKKAALKLLEESKAYYCFTPQEEIDKRRQEALNKKEHFIFKSQWRDAGSKTYPQDVAPVIRLKAPREGSTIIHDKLQGDVIIDNSHLDDMVLLRSDGTATYMLAVVVDDHDMGVTHIIRGDDHLTNAARQILLYEAFNWPVPVMVHIPLIHGPDGAKLSKRHGALGMEAYKEMGYLPQALCNYLLRLGWSHGNDEIINSDQAIKWFDLEGLGKSPARLDFAKMKHLNSHYLRELDDDSLVDMVTGVLQQNHNISLEVKSYIKKGISGLKSRSELLTGLASLAKIYLVDVPLEYEPEAIAIIEKCDKSLIEEVKKEVELMEAFDKDSLQINLKNIAEKNALTIGQLMTPIRALITGKIASPSVFEIMSIIGKNNTMIRLSVSNSWSTK
jgi:glutamyl-tRNA synthetase